MLTIWPTSCWLALNSAFILLNHGVWLWLAGPNAGKSTLMNALAGYRRAIVHSEPGTTRDIVTLQHGRGRLAG